MELRNRGVSILPEILAPMDLEYGQPAPDMEAQQHREQGNESQSGSRSSAFGIFPIPTRRNIVLTLVFVCYVSIGCYLICLINGEKDLLRRTIQLVSDVACAAGHATNSHLGQVCKAYREFQDSNYTSMSFSSVRNCNTTVCN